jgi:hypothetical protein
MARTTGQISTRGPRSARPELQSEHISTAFRAVVEFNADPEQRGRVKIRIYALHGPQGTDPKTRLKVEDLPWAMPAFPLAGGQDYGSFVVPPVGSSVWIMAAGNEADQYVYFGGYYTIPLKGEEYLRAMGQPKHEVSMAGGADVWTGDPGPNAPLDALEMLHATPEVYVPAKSVKGAALVMNDKDERESTALIDRAGQGLFLEAEVQKGPNKNNAMARGTRNASRGTSPISVGGDTVAGETRVLLIDAGGQSVTLHPHTGAERIRIVSRPVEGDSANYAGHKDEMAVEIDAGARRVAITSSSGGDSGARVVVDAAAKYVEISGDVIIRLLARSVEVSGRLAVRGDLLVQGDIVATGDIISPGRGES